jgi:tripartite-type tricarboxylate transporter receptor subunit TctC
MMRLLPRRRTEEDMHRKSMIPALVLSSLIGTAGNAGAAGAAGDKTVEWPDKPVKLVVGYPAGGPNDTIARAIGQRLMAADKQPVIVENKPGASGTIGSEYVARAAPDGYTLMLNATTHSMVNALYDKLSFDADRDFTPISMVGTSTLVLVANPDFPIRTVQDLIDKARAQPGKIAFASTGLGSSPHLAGEMFKQMMALDLIHVPYKGSAPAITDVIGGQVPIMFEALPSAAPFIKSGKLRAIAVTTNTRSAEFPDVPTMAQAGIPGFEITVWWGVFGPARIPPALATQISTAVNETLRTREIKTQFDALGITPAGSTPEQFRSVLQADIQKYGRIIKEAGIHAN